MNPLRRVLFVLPGLACWFSASAVFAAPRVSGVPALLAKNWGMGYGIAAAMFCLAVLAISVPSLRKTLRRK